MPFTQRTAFAPDAVSVVEMFLLPDRCRMLDRLDGQPAGPEGLIAVFAAGSHHHGNIADPEPAFGVRDPKFNRLPNRLFSLGGDSAETDQGQRLENIVADTDHLPAVVEVPDFADEHRDAAKPGIGDEIQCGHRVQRTLGTVLHGKMMGCHINPH